MKLSNITFRDEPVFIPFAELGEKYGKIDINAPFKRTLRCGRKFEICRSDYLDATCSMATGTISDAAMEKIATALKQEFDTYIDKQTDDEAFDEAFWREEENLLVEIGVPYFEDDDKKDYAVGERVFYLDAKDGCYATIMELHPEDDEIIIKSDSGETISAYYCEVVKEF